MKKIIIVIGIVIISLTATFYLFAVISGFSFFFHPFFERCTNLVEGMTGEEVSKEMGDFLGSSSYDVIESGPGNYGWGNRLSYDNSLMIVLKKEPWYKLDQHPWRCEISFKDNLAIDIEAVFD